METCLLHQNIRSICQNFGEIETNLMKRDKPVLIAPTEIWTTKKAFLENFVMVNSSKKGDDGGICISKNFLQIAEFTKTLIKI